MKNDEIRSLALHELDQKEADLREEGFNLRFQHAVGKLENTARLKEIRKGIARIKTVKSARAREAASSVK